MKVQYSTPQYSFWPTIIFETNSSFNGTFFVLAWPQPKVSLWDFTNSDFFPSSYWWKLYTTPPTRADIHYCLHPSTRADAERTDNARGMFCTTWAWIRPVWHHDNRLPLHWWENRRNEPLTTHTCSNIGILRRRSFKLLRETHGWSGSGERIDWAMPKASRHWVWSGNRNSILKIVHLIKHVCKLKRVYCFWQHSSRARVSVCQCLEDKHGKIAALNIRGVRHKRLIYLAIANSTNFADPLSNDTLSLWPPNTCKMNHA